MALRSLSHVLLLTAILILATYIFPCDAFLSSLLALARDDTQTQTDTLGQSNRESNEFDLISPENSNHYQSVRDKFVDPSRDVVLSGGNPFGKESIGSTRGSSSFHLPSLAALHANLKELVETGAEIPSRCRAVSAETTLWSRCKTLNSADKTYLAVAFTECHFDLFTRKYDTENVRSCQDIIDPREMADCVKTMNTPDVFPIFIQFKTTLESLCREVDHDFARRRSHEAMDAIYDATLHTAKSLGQLQIGTEALTSELQSRLEHSSSAVLELLSSHSQVETDRFNSLSDSAKKLEDGQSSLMSQLEGQTQNVKKLLLDAQGIQALINATSADIASTQVDIITLQQSAVSVLDDTRTEMIELRRTQQQHFEDALKSLQILRTLSDSLHEAQEANTDAVTRLAIEQEQAFQDAASKLSRLHEDQTAAFKDGVMRMESIRTLQSDITASQSDLLSSVKMSSEELRNLAEAQRTSFEQTGSSLHRIQQQASEVESKLGAMLLEIKSMATQLLNLNLDVLAELFHIQSAVFYVALTPFVYFATATERTKAARFWIFLMLISTLLLELNLVSAAQRFQYHLSQMEFDRLRERLRYALAFMSMLVLSLTALLHRDYVQLNLELNQRNARVIQNNHRMLHELLRRTEKMADREREKEEQEAPKSYYPPNPFQQPSSTSPSRENPRKEGVPASTTADGMPDLEPSWHSSHVEGPDACCRDQRTQPSVFAKMFAVVSSPRASSKPQVSVKDESTAPTHMEYPTSTRLLSPRPSPRHGHDTASSAAEDDSIEPGLNAAYQEGESTFEGTSSGRSRRLSRSRSRATEQSERVASASATKKRRAPARSVKEEQDGADEEQPGETGGVEPPVKQRRKTKISL